MAERLSTVGLLLRPNMPYIAPSPLGRIHNSARGPLWTNVATWPRWTPMRTLAEMGNPSLRSYAHESVAERERLGETEGLAEQKRYWLRVGERRRVVVRARYQWEYTGIVLEPGVRYALRADGSWQDWKDSPVGAEGQSPGDQSLLKRLARPLKRVREGNWLELIALPCHDFGWHWRELGVGRALYYLLIDDPAEFKSQYLRVGRGCEIVGPAGSEAMLWCFGNDARKFYGNNTGSVLLEVQRLE